MPQRPIQRPTAKPKVASTDARKPSLPKLNSSHEESLEIRQILSSSETRVPANITDPYSKSCLPLCFGSAEEMRRSSHREQNQSKLEMNLFMRYHGRQPMNWRRSLLENSLQLNLAIIPSIFDTEVITEPQISHLP